MSASDPLAAPPMAWMPGAFGELAAALGGARGVVAGLRGGASRGLFRVVRVDEGLGVRAGLAGVGADECGYLLGVLALDDAGGHAAVPEAAGDRGERAVVAAFVGGVAAGGEERVGIGPDHAVRACRGQRMAGPAVADEELLAVLVLALHCHGGGA